MKKNKLRDFDDSYGLKSYQICPFEKLKIGESNLFHPLRNEGYEYVVCVEDKKSNRVIEIVNGHMYQKIEMMSSYFLDKQRIIDNKRYAICPIGVCPWELNNDEINRINNIINKLDNEEEFINGNYVMTNSEYRESINNYNKVAKEKNKKRIKRIKRIKGR